MMRMLEEMTGFDFFWHHHVSNFRGATLDNGEENNYCSSNIKSKHFSPVISCRSLKLSEQKGHDHFEHCNKL